MMFFSKLYFRPFYKLSKVIFPLLFLISFISCADATSLPTPPLQYPNVLHGQVYNLSHPGPIPVGWVPPPYENVCTVIAHDIQQGISLEVMSDSRGQFKIMAPPGNYYLLVKESYLSSETGPYRLNEGDTIEVKVYFDNGMR